MVLKEVEWLMEVWNYCMQMSYGMTKSHFIGLLLAKHLKTILKLDAQL